MSNELVETGWQRFLERLKQLWGKSRNSDLPATATRTAVAEATGVPGTTGRGSRAEARRGLSVD
jgi:hypothetical protein